MHPVTTRFGYGNFHSVSDEQLMLAHPFGIARREETEAFQIREHG
ncbi:hypothetical protein [Gulosibacter macacae]|nr:hypothetical protein [Gulosibacter macacae]